MPLTAREWFESIAGLRQRVANLEDAISSAYTSAGPHGQRLGTIGGSAQHDALEAIDHLIDSGTVAEYESAYALLTSKLDRATDVLYGSSGRGGLAKVRSYTDADILFCHYLQGMGWAEIADEIVKPDSECPRKWCQMRAMRALRYIDRVGMDALADS